MNKAHVNDNNVLQFDISFVRAINTELRRAADPWNIFFDKLTKYTRANNVKTANIKMTLCLNTVWLFFSA